MPAIDQFPAADRAHIDYIADLYGVVIGIESLEGAFRRDIITSEQYNTTVRRLLDKYHSIVKHLDGAQNPFYKGIDTFLKTYCSRCPAALAIIKSGPSTGQCDNVALRMPRQVKEAVECFITLMDTLKLQMTAVDQLQPLLTDLVNSLKRFNTKGESFFLRLQQWHEKLDGLNASTQLDDTTVREFSYDLERSYSGFSTFLENHGSSTK